MDVNVNGVLVPLTRTCTAVMSGIEVIGTVTVVEAVTPVSPDSVKLTLVELAVKLVTVAGVVAVAVQPVPQLVVVVATNVKVAVAAWTNVPLVPVTVTAKTPAAAELHARVAVPEPVTVPGVIAPHVRPAGAVSVRVTTPENPLIAVTVIVEVAD